MSFPLERSIALAALDMADALAAGLPPAKRKAVADFLEAALWGAASAAEGLAKSSAWVDANKDDGWLRGAGDERYELGNINDKQFRDLAERLHLGVDMLEKSLPARIRMEPELERDVQRIIGKPVGAPGKAPSLDNLESPEPKLEQKPAPEAEKLSPAEAEDIITPPKRDKEMPRSDIEEKDNEFNTPVTVNPNLPGAPK